MLGRTLYLCLLTFRKPSQSLADRLNDCTGERGGFQWAFLHGQNPWQIEFARLIGPRMRRLSFESPRNGHDHRAFSGAGERRRSSARGAANGGGAERDCRPIAAGRCIFLSLNDARGEHEVSIGGMCFRFTGFARGKPRFLLKALLLASREKPKMIFAAHPESRAHCGDDESYQQRCASYCGRARHRDLAAVADDSAKNATARRYCHSSEFRYRAAAGANSRRAGGKDTRASVAARSGVRGHSPNALTNFRGRRDFRAGGSYCRSVVGRRASVTRALIC